QIASPQKIYDEPANAFVADFIGESTILSGVMLEDFKVEFCDTVFECVDKGFKKNEPIDVIIRPEDLKIRKPDDNKTILTAEVLSCVFKGDHYQVTVLAGGNELIAHDTASYEVGETVGLYIKPFDLHIMRKARIINEIETTMADENLVNIADGQFKCECSLPAGTPVKVSVDFDDVEITDDEEVGVIGSTVVSSIYKGSYYQCIVRTDDYYDFFVDTDDDWLKGDRVGIKIAKDKFIIEERQVVAGDEEIIEIPEVVLDEVDPELSKQLAEEIKTEAIEQAIEEDATVVYNGEIIETPDKEEDAE
ncbi:MAG: TOBE domain-containing protein, partial [Clostridia bacterium]|nr:TOBE domain-containing protein [Clostridia bacterium]